MSTAIDDLFFCVGFVGLCNSLLHLHVTIWPAFFGWPFWRVELRRLDGWNGRLQPMSNWKICWNMRLFVFFCQFLSGNWWLELVGTLCRFIHHSGLWLLHDHRTAMKPRESDARRLIFSHLEEALTSQTRGVSFSSEDASLPWLVGLVFFKRKRKAGRKRFLEGLDTGMYD